MRCSFKISTSLLLLLGASAVAAILPVLDTGSQSPLEGSPDTMGKSQSKQASSVESDGPPIVSDALSVQRDVSIFAEFVRGSATIMSRLDDRTLNTTILAPLNSAIKALPRKPWEDPDPDSNYNGAFTGLNGEKRAAANLERFVKAHMIPVSPFNEGERIRTLEGREIWWLTEDGVTKIYPGGIEVKQVKNSVPNGQIWTIKGIINY